jgi:hypothetical protein
MSTYIQVATRLPDATGSLDEYTINSCQDCDNNDDYCTGHCVESCNKFLNEEQNANPDLCCHYNDTGYREDNEIACCDNNCGQSENMANCGVLVKDNCQDRTKNGGDCAIGMGRVVCTRACDRRCPTFGNIRATTNFFQNPAVFHNSRFDSTYNAYVGANCETDDCKQGSAFCSNLANGNFRPWQNCIYDSTQFQGAAMDDIDAYRSAYPEDRNYDEVMTQWCSAQVSDNCPDDPITQKPQSSCIRYRARNAEGSLCETWITNKTTDKQNYIDAMASNYCSRYNTPECMCVNRGINEIYQQTKHSAPFNDGCWYQPCAETYSDYYLRPSDVMVDKYNPDMCPSNFCGSFVNAQGYNANYINNNKNYINCDFD